ncbi:unnamed protein product [Ilex paraguariensis]|uniref:RRM domain-containing protein n=1 Tax=Ilex paraguariensis TaxID=185542 RepID=A0ABC8TVA0_9AQUA
MAKKPKEPCNKANGNNVSSSGSSDVFKTLFGDIPEQSTTSSIFSTDNPFRRKPFDRSETPTQQKLGSRLDSAEVVENPKSGDSDKPNSVELKKRKKDAEQRPYLNSDSVGEASEIHLESKKSKKAKPEYPGFDSKLRAGKKGRNAVLGSDSKEFSVKGKGKKGDFGMKSKGMSYKEEKASLDVVIESEDYSGKGEGENPNVAMELNGTVNLDSERKGKKKKKRKRDEVEAEYESKRYGVVAVQDGGEEGNLGGVGVGKKRKKLDNPEDMMVSKEGFDDEGKLLRTVFVGNLPLKVKKKALLKEFSKFGEVESVRIRSIPLIDTKVPRKGAIINKKINDAADSVHAYIVFKTEEHAHASLAHNMAVVGGNHMRVDRACPPRKKLKGDDTPLYDNKKTVFVGNLPFDVKTEEIYELFSGINGLESNIEAIRVIRDPNTNVGKGIAYVLFKTRDAANLVIRKRNLKLRDRELRLYHAKSNSTPSKRKNSSLEEANNTPTKKFAPNSSTPDGSNKVKSRADISYQGLRATKSGVQKKFHPKIIEPVNLKTKAQQVQKPKERKQKRPAVAARKVNVLKGSGALKQAGTKRKLDNRTPDSARRNKKTRKFR